MKALEKLATVNDNFTVNMYDNGFMVEIGGRDKDDNWKTLKLTFASIDHVHELIDALAQMPRTD